MTILCTFVCWRHERMDEDEDNKYKTVYTGNREHDAEKCPLNPF